MVNMDAKGRVAIPARFRDALLDASVNQLVFTINPNTQNLAAYAPKRWDDIEETIMSLSSMDEETRRFQHLFVAHAHDLELDSAGRVLLPSDLRDHAQLTKKVVFVGLRDKIEIWDEAIWNARIDTLKSQPVKVDDLPDSLKGLVV